MWPGAIGDRMIDTFLSHAAAAPERIVLCHSVLLLPPSRPPCRNYQCAFPERRALSIVSSAHRLLPPASPRPAPSSASARPHAAPPPPPPSCLPARGTHTCVVGKKEERRGSSERSLTSQSQTDCLAWTGLGLAWFGDCGGGGGGLRQEGGGGGGYRWNSERGNKWLSAHVRPFVRLSVTRGIDSSPGSSGPREYVRVYVDIKCPRRLERGPRERRRGGARA